MLYTRLHRRIMWSWGTDLDDPDVRLASVENTTLPSYTPFDGTHQDLMEYRDFPTIDPLQQIWFEDSGGYWWNCYTCGPWSEVPEEEIPSSLVYLSLDPVKEQSVPGTPWYTPYQGVENLNGTVFYGGYRFKDGATHPESFGSWDWVVCVLKDFNIYCGEIPQYEGPRGGIVPIVTAIGVLSYLCMLANGSAPSRNPQKRMNTR